MVGLLTVASCLCLALGGMAMAAGSFTVRIVKFEQARSLGNGALARLLDSPDETVARRAALAIGRTKQPAGLPLLLARAHSPDPAMRALCVYGIGLIGGPAAARASVAALKDPSGAVRVAALDGVDREVFARAMTPALARVAERRVAHVLLHDRNAVLRARAATTLETFGAGPLRAPAQRALIRSFETERSTFVRRHDMWALFRAYSKSAPLALFERGARDRDSVVRLQAVRALGRRGDASALPLLRRLTNDRSWRVQEQSLESIRALTGEQMTQHMVHVPAIVHTPAPRPDRFASLRPLPRTFQKASKPNADAIITRPALDPSTVSLMTGPAQGPHPRVRIVTTQGNITLELYPEWAPLTVENFLNLANAGYYDGNPWFRVVPDFVVQSGDMNANSNGPGYTIPAEENPIEEGSYVIAMGLDYTNPPNAHAIRDSAGSEFYITLSPQLHLDRDFSVFGRVIGGRYVLGRLAESDKILRVERLPDSRR